MWQSRGSVRLQDGLTAWTLIECLAPHIPLWHCRSSQQPRAKEGQRGMGCHQREGERQRGEGCHHKMEGRQQQRVGKRRPRVGESRVPRVGESQVPRVGERQGEWEGGSCFDLEPRRGCHFHSHFHCHGHFHGHFHFHCHYRSHVQAAWQLSAAWQPPLDMQGVAIMSVRYLSAGGWKQYTNVGLIAELRQGGFLCYAKVTELLMHE